jgi:hypothetical protein
VSEQPYRGPAPDERGHERRAADDDARLDPMAVCTTIVVLGCAVFRASISLRDQEIDVDGVIAVVVIVLASWWMVRQWRQRRGGV